MRIMRMRQITEFILVLAVAIFMALLFFENRL